MSRCSEMPQAGQRPQVIPNVEGSAPQAGPFRECSVAGRRAWGLPGQEDPTGVPSQGELSRPHMEQIQTQQKWPQPLPGPCHTDSHPHGGARGEPQSPGAGAPGLERRGTKTHDPFQPARLRTLRKGDVKTHSRIRAEPLSPHMHRQDNNPPDYNLKNRQENNSVDNYD